MKELTLKYQKPQMKINGTVFDLQMSDYEIVQFGVAMIDKYKDTAKQHRSAEQTQADVEELSSLVDTMLGPGATEILAAGRPVSLKLIVSWFAEIVKAACEEYAENAAK